MFGSAGHAGLCILLRKNVLTSNFSKVHIDSYNLHKLKLERVAHNFVESVLKTLENSWSTPHLCLCGNSTHVACTFDLLFSPYLARAIFNAHFFTVFGPAIHPSRCLLFVNSLMSLGVQEGKSFPLTQDPALGFAPFLGELCLQLGPRVLSPLITPESHFFMMVLHFSVPIRSTSLTINSASNVQQQGEWGSQSATRRGPFLSGYVILNFLSL